MVFGTPIEFDQRDKGFNKCADTVKSLKNPTPVDGNYTEKKKVLSKVKSISVDDEQKLFTRLKQEDDNTLFAALILIKYLGCRPAELYNIEFLQGHSIYIPSAKKTLNRGLDRTIKLTGTDATKRYKHLEQAHQILLSSGFTDPVRYAQKRLLTIAKQLWPQRKRVPCLYTWRHQMGADLKASGKSRKEIAALMGHLSVESLTVYGRPRNARSRRDYISAHPSTIRQVKDSEPTLPPSQRKSHRKNKSISTRLSAKGGRNTSG